MLCQSAASAIASLPAQDGLKLSCDQQVGRQIVSIDVRNVQPTDLRARLAKVLSGEWERDGNRLVLKRSAALERSLRRAEALRRLELYHRALADQGRKASLDNDFDDGAARALAVEAEAAITRMRQADGDELRYQAIRSASEVPLKTPAGRLLLHLLSDQVLSEIIGAPALSRIVFSSSPNRAQRDLHLSREALAEFSKEQRLWHDAVAKFAPVEGKRLSSFDARQWTDASAPAKVDLVVNRTIFSENIQAQLLIADADGKLIARIYLFLPVTLAHQTVDALPGEKHDLVIPGPVRTLGKLIDGYESGEGVDKLSVADLAIATDFKHGDPLLASAEAVALAAARRRGNYLAVLPDAVYALCREMKDKTSTDSTEVLNAACALNMHFDEDGDWIIGKPDFPLREEDYQIDRTELSKLMATIQTNRTCTISMLAEYASQATGLGTFHNGFDQTLISLMQQAVGASVTTQSYWTEGLRFYFSLSPAARDRLEHGDSLSIRDLSPPQAAALSEMVYQSMPDFILRIPEGEDKMLGFTSLLGETTELLPDGIPSDGSVVLKSAESPVARAINDDGSAGPSKTPKDFSANSKPPATGTRILKTFTFTFTKLTGFDLRLSEDHFR